MTTKKAASKKMSGSQKMRASRGEAQTAEAKPGSSQLHKALAALDRSRIDHNILIRGTPHPDVIKGTFKARDLKQLNAALGTLLKVPSIEYKPVKLFPKGIPVIDLIEVQIDGRQRR